MKNFIKEIIKKLVFKYTDIGNADYKYNVEPAQLAEIINSLDSLSNVDGNICEIGVARGMTTRFICEHLVNTNFQGKYYCIDTFDSFTNEDVKFEIKFRKKSKNEISGFSYNNFNKWKKNFKNYEFLEAFKSDIKNFDLSSISPLKFCFLDVDLYLPTKFVLENISKHMIDGGILIVDDVRDNDTWDGSYEAFMEYVTKNNLDYKLVGNKSALIKY